MAIHNPTIESKLKELERASIPCPFCGASGRIIRTLGRSTRIVGRPKLKCGYYMKCANSDNGRCPVKVQTPIYVIPERALQAWNTRAISMVVRTDSQGRYPIMLDV